MNKKRYFVLVLMTLILISVVGLTLFYYIKKQRPAYNSTTMTPTSVLRQTNQDFSTGDSFSKQGDYKQALLSYQRALPQAEDLVQEGQIKYKIASMYEFDGRYTEAIKLFKEIAINTKYDTFVRAYSVQEIGYMYKKPATTKEARSLILAETFNSAPYDSFLTGGDYDLAYRKLFEYASSIYPLVISESFIAGWYAHDLRFNLKGASTTSAGGENIFATLESLKKANDDITRTKDDPVASGYFPTAYVYLGIAQGDLAIVGALDPELAEASFRKGINLIATAGFNSGNLAPYNYASFLVNKYGAKRSNDIRDTLSVFSTANSKKIYPHVVNLFRDARTDKSLAEDYTNLKLLGGIDSNFKKYLISLGWNESDFTIKVAK